MSVLKDGLRRNLMYGFLAQFITFSVSCIVTFILPKFLGVLEYSYWQLFIFYVGYVCFFHFGIPDGIYLCYGGKTIDDLPIDSISKQFRFMLIYQLLIAIGIVVFSSFEADNNRVIVGFLVAGYLLVVNFNNYYGMIYQAVNNARWYSTSIIIDKIVFCILIIVMLMFGIDSFYPYAIAFCIGRLMSCFYSFVKYPQLLACHSKYSNWKNDLIDNIKSGSKLMFSVISSSLVLGIARFIVDNKWGIETFGYLSFSLTISNFVLQFINQIAIVLFPNLRMIEKEKIADAYMYIRRIVCIVLEASLFIYIPMGFFVKGWLSQYSVSLHYMAYFLPICIFDGKMQLLAVSYMKTLRKEDVLLRINVISLIYSSLMCSIGAYVFNSMWVVVFGMISSILIRSFVSEVYISKKLNINIFCELVVEVLIFVTYWVLMVINRPNMAFVFYSIIYCIRIVKKVKDLKLSKVVL